MHFFVILLLPVAFAHAQSQPDTVIVLDEIQVEAARSLEVERQAPFSLFVFERVSAGAATDPATSMEDLARQVPGLWVADRDHLALGERISLRGASARSPFGTRGIQIFADGIPLTAPDGQAMSEIIDPSMVRRIEVIRGPASTFWGNASAGTLWFSSIQPNEEPAATFRMGSFGDYYAGISGTAAGEQWNGRGYLSHRSHAGYREHADGIMNRGGLHVERELSPSSHLRVVAAAAWQDANSPGSLTQSEWDEDATAANPAYIRTASGKISTQGQAGIFWSHGVGEMLIETGLYGIIREMENPLPYAVIDLSRAVSGARANVVGRTGRLDWAFGADAAVQSDGRLNFANVGGVPGDQARLDQREQVTSGGLSLYARYQPRDGFYISSGLRGDLLRYVLSDNLDDENDGSRTFHALSPSLGLSLSSGPVLYYASVATSFETPTTTELVNRPDGRQGFHPDLKPERTVSIEFGLRGALTSRLYLDASAFCSRISNRLLSYQTESGGDQTFFRNAEAGHQSGAEFYFLVQVAADLELSGSYSFLHATFIDTDGQRRRLPGVPDHFGSAELAFRPSDWAIRARFDAASGMYADDSNLVEVDGFLTLALGIGHEYLPAGGVVIRPFMRLENLLDSSYSRSIVVNASGDRFYEPSPGRSIQAGITVSF